MAVVERVWTVVVAGGSGTRFGRPKQFEHLAGQRVIDHALAVAASSSHGVVLVVPADRVLAEQHEQRAPGSRCVVVAGGASRSESVRCGLASVPDEATIVCVHDAARPLASPELYRAVVDAVLGGADGAVPGLPVTDTVKEVGADGTVVRTLDRGRLVTVQTPQAFRYATLRSAHAADGEGTDDASLVERLGGRVVVVPGDPRNRKLTHPEDLEWAEAQLRGARR